MPWSADFGGKEFGVAVPLTSESEAADAAERILNPMRRSFAVNGRDIKLGFALGYAVGTAESNSIALIRSAGVALHEAKSPQSRGISVVSADTEQRMRTRMRLTEDLGSAVANREFILHFQPKVRLDTGSIIGVESLARWEHPVFGPQGPDRFISIAEDTGHIVGIGHWALRCGRAICQAAEYQPRTPHSGGRECFTCRIHASEHGRDRQCGLA